MSCVRRSSGRQLYQPGSNSWTPSDPQVTRAQIRTWSRLVNYGPDNPIPPSSVAPPRYQPIRTLREGGFGRVLLAMDTLTQKQVAVKVLKATWSATHQARFRREVEGTRKLRSHRVIKILGYELANNPPFYVMPYLSRGSLRQHLMDLARKQEVFSQPAALIAA